MAPLIGSIALLLLLLLALGTFLPQASSEIRHFGFRADDRRIIPLDEFGFTSTGAVELNATAISLSQPTAGLDLSLLGFFLVNRDSWVHVLRQLDDGLIPCAFRSDLVLTVYSFRQLAAGGIPISSAAIASFYTAPEPGEFMLVFTNCLPRLKVSMDVTTAMYNVDPSTNRRTYLSVGATVLPRLYLFFFAAYVVLAGVWAVVLRRKRQTAFHVHYLMLSLVVLKSLDLLCESLNLSYLNGAGAPHRWDVPFYLFTFLKILTLFTAIALIGAGWAILNPYLHGGERSVLKAVIPLQVVVYVAQAAVDGLAWKQVLTLVDVVCCFAVLFPVAWSIKNLRPAAQVDGKAAVVLRKLTLFKQYYLVVVGYIYFTRALAFALDDMASYQYRWVGAAAAEVATLAFYLFTGYKFRPVVRNPYFALEEEDDEGTIEILKLRYDAET